MSISFLGVEDGVEECGQHGSLVTDLYIHLYYVTSIPGEGYPKMQFTTVKPILIFTFREVVYCRTLFLIVVNSAEHTMSSEKLIYC